MNNNINIIQKRNAIAYWLNNYNWDWYVTLTFRDDVNNKKAFKLFNTWKIDLKKASNNKIQYVMIIEKSKFREDIPHIHLLLSGAKYEKPNEWEGKWFSIAGIAMIELYDSNMGAKYYLGEKIARGYSEMKFSKGLIAPTESLI